ncbi:MAG: MBOAT family protein [Candidatus Odyssella sp.]|nr:MBOAT family protein [Candidatus Odyssella sp.]
MLFPTLNFLIFFLIVLAVAWALVERDQWRKLFLTAASYVFYGFWDWRFTFLLLGNTLAIYAVGLWIGAARTERARKWAAWTGVAVMLVVLGFFKYFEFFVASLNELLRSAGLEREIPVFEVILPVGISFFTFQGISYVLDVYHRVIPPTRSFLDLALFKSFFPQLVAGPIVRAADFMPQLARKPDVTRLHVSLGLTLIVWGLFKKSIVANYLAIDLVDKAFMDPGRYGGLDLLLGVYGYAVQIYCDFSAYSDIAIGAAMLLGYTFPRNFDQPYRAASLSEFWRRWHISLSSWLRDYLYIPLGGNRKGPIRTYVNLTITMLLGGLWHGAAWKFVMWGALHGVGLAAERLASGARRVSGSVWGPKPVAIVLVFHFVCLGWIFFRARDFASAVDVIRGLFDWRTPPELATPLSLALIALGLVMHFTPRDLVNRFEALFWRMPAAAMGVACGFAVALVEAFGLDGAAPFIYFQF